MKLRMMLLAATTAVLVPVLAESQASGAVPSYTAVPLQSPQPQANALFGGFMDTVGDLNGDGVNDVAIGAEGQTVGGVSNVGRVWVFDGRTRAVLRTFDDPDPQSNGRFGTSIISIGDVNGDGTPDLAIAAALHGVYTGTGTPCGAAEPNGCNELQGRVYVMSGKTGQLLHQIEDPTPQAFAFFGYGFAIATGDLNGDGVPDFVETAEGETRGMCDADFDPSTPPAPCPSVGAAYVFSGKTGSLIRRLDTPDPPQAYASFGGGGTTEPGDVTGDGVNDVVIGEFAWSDGDPPEDAGQGSAPGRAYVFNGRTGQLVRRLFSPADPGEDAGFGFGHGTGIEPGDVNGDGVPDILVDAPGKDIGAFDNAGALYIVSGADGSIIRRLTDPNPVQIGAFGFQHTSAGDVNGDGAADILAMDNAPFNDPAAPGARAYLLDPRTGGVLVSLPGMTANGPGSSVASPGDINGDGYPDYFLGGRVMGGENKGGVVVELSTPPPAGPNANGLTAANNIPGGASADTTAPGVSHFGVLNNPFVVGGRTPTFGYSARARHRKGTAFTYTLTEAATVRIVISQRRSGRRKGIRCVANRTSLRKKARCTIIVRKGTLTRISHPGVNRVPFSGRIGSKALLPGTYSATITATDAAKNTSGPKTISFTIVRR